MFVLFSVQKVQFKLQAYFTLLFNVMLQWVFLLDKAVSTSHDIVITVRIHRMNFSIFCHYLSQKKENYLWEYFQRYQSYSNKFWVFPSIPFLCGRSPSGNSELKTRYRIYSMACIDPRFFFSFFFFFSIAFCGSISVCISNILTDTTKMMAPETILTSLLFYEYN